MNQHGVILFHTTAAVFRAEKVLTQAGFPIKAIPTPRQYSSDCGIALRFPWEQKEQIAALLQASRVEIAGIYPL